MFIEFISTAYADAGNVQQPSAMPTLIMLGAFMVIFYFLMLRPQQKRNKEHKNLLQALQVGDEVMIAGGIIGKIKKIKDEYCVLTVSENSDIRVQKSSVINALPKGTIKGIDEN